MKAETNSNVLEAIKAAHKYMSERFGTGKDRERKEDGVGKKK